MPANTPSAAGLHKLILISKKPGGLFPFHHHVQEHHNTNGCRSLPPHVIIHRLISKLYTFQHTNVGTLTPGECWWRLSNKNTIHYINNLPIKKMLKCKVLPYFRTDGVFFSRKTFDKRDEWPVSVRATRNIHTKKRPLERQWTAE